MQLMPRVTIGLPVYNGDRYVAEAIESVLGQTFADFDLIIADNASTDATEAICRRYAAADSRVRYVRNQHNIGAARNFDLTLQLASGEYFKWLAADDALEPQFLQVCVDLLDADPALVAACTRCLGVDQHGDVFARFAHDHDFQSQTPHERFQRFLRGDEGGAAWPIFGLIRRAALVETALIRPFIGSDYCLVAELVLKGRIAQSPLYLNRLRNHPDAYTISQGQKNARRDGMLGASEAQWLDPSSSGVVYLPHWRRIWEYLRLVRNASVTPRRELLMVGGIIRHAVAQWRVILLKELMFALALGRLYIFSRNTIKKASYRLGVSNAARM
jgi:glycosyltransferase involved in cell wall biosynthesis